MHLQFFGAAGEVTGSCHILEVGRHRILLDCGLIQGGATHGERNRAPFPFDAAQIDAVILSHAHIDHSGRLPLLHKRGFRGPVFATAACRDLARVLLLDCAALAAHDAARAARRRRRNGGQGAVEPLFTEADAEAVLGMFRSVRYGQPFQVLPGVELTFRDAGHILGSACVCLRLVEGDLERRLVFSGDLGQYDSRRSCGIRKPGSRLTVVLMESTYGGRLHRDREATLAEFGEILLRDPARRWQRADSRFRGRPQPGSPVPARHPLRRVAARSTGRCSSTVRWQSRRRKSTGGIRNSSTRRRANCTGAKNRCRRCRISSFAGRPKSRWRSTASPTARS